MPGVCQPLASILFPFMHRPTRGPTSKPTMIAVNRVSPSTLSAPMNSAAASTAGSTAAQLWIDAGLASSNS
ncbi:hypothetical protein D3C86_1410530 [compost metagenome]